MLACLTCVCPVRTEDSPDASTVKLGAIQSAFRKSLIGTILPEKREHLERVRELEKKLISSRDYATAIRARDERLALEHEITALEQELPMLTARVAGEGKMLPERIPLKLADATLMGLKMDKEGALTGWNETQSAATWKLPGLPSGGYEIIMKYSCGKNDGGTVVIKESFYLLRGEVSPTSDKPVEKNLGTLRIRDGQGSLTIAASATPKGDLMRLWSLELAPVNR